MLPLQIVMHAMQLLHARCKIRHTELNKYRCSGSCVDIGTACTEDSCSCTSPDLALNKPAISDPPYSGFASSANDGDDATFWYSYNIPSYWRVNLLVTAFLIQYNSKMNYELGSIYFKTRYPMKDFNVSTSQDGQTFTTLSVVVNAPNTGSQEFTFNAVGTSAKYVQVTVSATHSSVAEIVTLNVLPHTNCGGASTTSSTRDSSSGVLSTGESPSGQSSSSTVLLSTTQDSTTEIASEESQGFKLTCELGIALSSLFLALHS